MTYSIINVVRRCGRKVDGYWMQDCIGTHLEALQRAALHRAANGGRIDVAVTKPVTPTMPRLHYFTDLEVA